jgi:tripartite-type tricarboxylate transporter receptor subunit TctC
MSSRVLVASVMAGALALVAAFVPRIAQAQAQADAAAAYPSKPIRYVVPYPPGGPLDIVARVLGQKLAERWGQAVIVDNRAGAGGNIGVDLVAKAPADGYTIVMGAVATHAINVHLYAKLPFDPIRDFAPVVLITQVPNILVVNPQVAARSVKELIALAKAKPGSLNFGSGSTGSAGHLAGELFKTTAGVDMVHVPYKGAAPAVADLLAGQVQIMFDNLSSALPNVKSGRLRALAVTTAKRSPQVPDLPTIAEAGLPGFDVSTWFGIFAPAATPRPVVAKLNRELVATLGLPEVRERLAQLGAEPAPNTPEEFAAFVRAELAKYGKVVKASGARVD